LEANRLNSSDHNNGSSDEDGNEGVDYYEPNSVQGINDEYELYFSNEFLQKSSATFLLGLKEKFKLTQVALQGVI